jgi:hypothetical protein
MKIREERVEAALAKENAALAKLEILHAQLVALRAK